MVEKGTSFVKHARSFVEVRKLARFLVPIHHGVLTESCDDFVQKMKSLPIFMHGFMLIRAPLNKQYFPVQLKAVAVPAVPAVPVPEAVGMFQFV
jgi:hypothetical protein